jgi:hypothetical protein
MSGSYWLRAAFAAGVALGLMTSPATAQITTGTITGSVHDNQGGVVPGATVTLVSEARSLNVGTTVTNAEGTYAFPNIATDTYRIEVSLAGFKTTSRGGLQLSGGDRMALPVLVLEVGGVSDRVDVVAETPLVQAASGERSTTIGKVQLDNLPIQSRTFLSFLSLQAGIVNNSTDGGGSQMRRIGGGGQDNVMLDGLSALDTGNNGIMGGMNLPVEAIAEVKVMTSGYSAEYGRSSGAQITAVTRSGSNRFSGGIYDVERNSDWNANSWANKKNGNAKAIDKERDWGFTLGGPLGKPGGNNKLFFFYTQEFRPRENGGGTVNYRMPTELERRGDFSQTLDNNGALYNFIYDASTGLPKTACSATDQRACYASGGVLGRVPMSRLYGPGVAWLNMFPMPNTEQVAGQAWNYRTTTPIRNNLDYLPTIKVDFQANPDLRLGWKMNSQNSRIVVNPGNLPGITDTLEPFPFSFNTSWNANYTITPSMFIEATYGINQNRLGSPPVSQISNRNNVVCPSDLVAAIPDCTMGSIGYLFPDAGIVDPGTYQAKALAAMGTPFFENGQIFLPPQINFAGTRIGNGPNNLTAYPGWLNINRIQQANVSVTKLQGRHTFKAGLYIEHSFKAQNQNANFQGTLNVNVDTNNPIDSQMAFSNLALGIYNSFNQQARLIEGNFTYKNIEYFLQDNWKWNNRLTLDYGARFYHDGPYVDKFRQVASFFQDRWSLANAPYLYVPGCVNNANPCSGNNRQAKDPRTGNLLGVGSSGLIGSAIVGSGDAANGMVVAGQGISNAGYTWPSFAVAPRFGGAYDVNGDQKMVLRGAVGLYFDRPDGNVAFGTVGNPPTAGSLTQQWGTLQDLSSSRLAFGPVPTINMNKYDSAIPKDLQWNLGVQRALPWASSMDISYVGHHAFHVLAGTQNGNPVNINTIDLGTTTSAAGQDPTQTGVALNNNLLRPFRGYSNINIQWPRFTRTFHSMQMIYRRSFRNGFTFELQDTWTLYDKGTTGLPGPTLRLDHGADGSWSIRDDQAEANRLFGNQGTARHLFRANFVFDLPDLRSENKALRAVSQVVNDWQLSGIYRGDTGGFYDVGYSYNSGPTGAQLTGSPDYSARPYILDLAALGSGCSRDQYLQIKNALVPSTSGASPMISTAVAGPQVGSVGLESGRNLLNACGDRRFDFAIQRTIRLGGGRALVLRADVYNAFNTVIFSGRQTQLQMNSVTDQTVRNSQFLADGTMDPARERPNQAGFGAANNAMGPRTVQVQARFTF